MSHYGSFENEAIAKQQGVYFEEEPSTEEDITNDEISANAVLEALQNSSESTESNE